MKFAYFFVSAVASAMLLIDFLETKNPIPAGLSLFLALHAIYWAIRDKDSK